jgi:predicted RNA binding protein YcfA (HicA-like mRNA interferase family)
MKLPRDLSGQDLVERLQPLGYRPTRQTGSHIRLTTERCGEHHVTIPKHDPLRIGTLASILSSIALHHGFSRDELLKRLTTGRYSGDDVFR